MYQIQEIKNYEPALLSHQLYFILRWGELVDNSPLHYRKIVPLCLRAVIREALQVIDYYKNKMLIENNIFEILEEVLSTLDSNTILASYFQDDWILTRYQINNFLSNKKNFCNIESEIKKHRQLDLPVIILKALYNKLENCDIPQIYSSYLKNELGKERVAYEKIDRYLELLIGELLYEGHNKQYLYNWGRGVFVKDCEQYFVNRIDRLSTLGKKNMRQFDCYLKLKLPEGYNYKSDDLIFFQNPVEARKKLENDSESEQEDVISNFFNSDKCIVFVKLNAVDEFSAINLAREKIISTTKLFTLENKNKQYNPGNLKEVVVYDVLGNQVIENPKIFSQKHGLHLSKTKQYIEINLSAGTLGNYQGLEQLLQWCRVIQDSPRETGLVAMWSMLEFLFVTEFLNKKQAIIEYSKPYVCQFYIKSLVWRSRNFLENNTDLHQNLLEQIQKTLGDYAIDYSNNEIKIHYLFQFLVNYNEEVNKIYLKNIMEQRYIGLIKKFMVRRGDKFWALVYLEDLEKQVATDLSRVYRMRNMLAHQAIVDKDFFDDTYEKMSFYLKLILDDILYSMYLQPRHTIYQIVNIKLESYKIYKKLLKNFSDNSVTYYRKLLDTKSLLT